MLRIFSLQVALVLGLGGVLFAAPARAQALHAVALFAPSEDEAKDLLTSLVELTFYAKVMGFIDVPRVMPAADLPGAPKDHQADWVVVLSFCSKADAGQRQKELKGRQAVDVFAVKGKFPDRCIPKGGFGRLLDEEKEYLRAIYREPKVAKPRVNYASYLQAGARFKEADMVLKKALEIEPDNYEAKSLLQMSKIMRSY